MAKTKRASIQIKKSKRHFCPECDEVLTGVMKMPGKRMEYPCSTHGSMPLRMTVCK